MAEIWRLLDTGLRSAAQNIALSRALLEARHAEEIASTLRFLRYTRCAVLGSDHSAAQELHVDHCSAHDIAIQRRLTGGAAVYLDDKQLGWELYLQQRDVARSDARAISRRICHAAATAVSALGVDARYRQPGDIEVDGRSVGSCGLARDGSAWLVQGLLYIDFDLARMLHVLRTPCADAKDRTLERARERMADLKTLLKHQPDTRIVRQNIAEAFESEFDVEFREADLTLSEQARYQVALCEIESPGWVDLVSRPAADAPLSEGVLRLPGRVLRASVIYDKSTQRMKQVWFSGDIVANPRRTIADLEAALREVPIAHVAAKIASFFASRPALIAPFTADDFTAAVRLALQRPLLAQNP